MDEVVAIERACSRTPWSKRMFMEELQNPLAHCFVCRRDDSEQPSVLGFICFRNVGEESELLNLAVDPVHRRSGIGKELMQFYLNLAEKTQVKRFYLEVETSNLSAIRLYESFSYQPVATRKRFYQDRFDALVMVRKA